MDNSSCGKRTRRKRTRGKRTRTNNPWMTHLAAFRKAHPNISYKQVMMEAKKTYKK